MKAAKEELRKEIRALRCVGERMSNACFNLGRDASPVPTDIEKRLMMAEAKSWDAIKRAEPTT